MSQTGPFQCECGQVSTGKFCTNCGKARPEEKTFQCECGYNGPVSNFCPNCGKAYAVPSVNEAEEEEAKAEIEACNNVKPSPKPAAGWTCPECGSEFETDTKCSKCGADIEQFLLFSLSEFSTAIPPRNAWLRVYKFDDTRLILENGHEFRFIPVSVLEPAYEIIKKYEIDKWEEYKDRLTGIMGGRQAISYWDGTQMVGTSTDNMLTAGAAYHELMVLFVSNRL